MSITVHRAERRKAKLRLAISGPSGSGKTLGALYIAKGLVGPTGKILLVDTERGSGDLYGNKMEYDVAPMEPPYLTEKYIEYIRYAEDNGYDCVILDSISHEWNGQGGLLEQNSELAARGNNSFTSWGKLTPKHNQFVDAMLNSKCHVIATMRSKTEYALTPDDNGKIKPEKRGSAPVQREGIDYEFTIVFDVANSHMAEATKDRSGLFTGEIFTINESVGERLRDWLDNGVDVPAPVPTPSVAQVSAPVQPHAPSQSPAPAKTAPKNKYVKSNVDTIRAKYIEKGWNTKIFDDAKFNDEIWDADMINADFKKRTDAEKSATPAQAPTFAPTKPKLTETLPKKTATETPAPEVTTKCPQCGRPSMTAAEAKHVEGLLETKDFDHTLCKDCITKMWNENKQQKTEPASLEEFKADIMKEATANHKRTIEQPFCVDCGNTRVLPDEEFDSRARYGVPLCKGCMSKRIAADLKVKQDTKPAGQKPSEKKTDENVCSVCGKKMTKTQVTTFTLMNPGKSLVCPDCASKSAEN